MTRLPRCPPATIWLTDQEPFRFSKTSRPAITLHEGDVAVNDFSDLSYADAFEAVQRFEGIPITQEKQLDWSDLYDRFALLKYRNDMSSIG
jgi:hypothetical protein